MDPITLALLAASTAGKVGTAISQNQKRRKLSKRADAVRPVKAIQQEDTDALNIAKMLAMQSELPSAAITRDRLAGATAGGVRTAIESAGSSAGALSAASSLYGKQMDAELDLAGKGADYQAANKARLVEALGRMGEKQEDVWKYNKDDPYQANMAAQSSLRNAAGLNLNSALSDMSKLGGMLLANKLGQGDTGSTPTIPYAPDVVRAQGIATPSVIAGGYTKDPARMASQIGGPQQMQSFNELRNNPNFVNYTDEELLVIIQNAQKVAQK